MTLQLASCDFEALYATTGQTSIPPELLLEAGLLTALCSLGLDRLLIRKLPLLVVNMSWTFLARFFARGKSDKEVTIHGIGGRGDSGGREAGVPVAQLARK